MQNKSFINKMFFVYFITDFVMGYIETFLLFKMFEQRLKVKIFCIHICDFNSCSNDNKIDGTQTCVYYFTTFLLWNRNRQLIQTGIMACRSTIDDFPKLQNKTQIFRSMYVRNATGLIHDKAKLLHILIIVFLIVWLARRSFSLPFIQLLKGFDYSGFQRIEICMMTNNTASSSSSSYHFSPVKLRVIYVTNCLLYSIGLTYFYFLALKYK